MSVIDVVGVAIAVAVGTFVAIGVAGEVFDAAWGIGETGADVIDWFPERRDRRRSDSPRCDTDRLRRPRVRW